MSRDDIDAIVATRHFDALTSKLSVDERKCFVNWLESHSIHTSSSALYLYVGVFRLMLACRSIVKTNADAQIKVEKKVRELEKSGVALRRASTELIQTSRRLFSVADETHKSIEGLRRSVKVIAWMVGLLAVMNVHQYIAFLLR